MVETAHSCKDKNGTDMTALVPSVYLGSISYYRILAGNHNVLREEWEHYVKQTYRNRCAILGANGKLGLSIPIQHTGKRTIIREVKIANSEKWQRLHWRTIETAYRSSPYFEYYEDDLEPYYNTRYDLLIDFNTAIENAMLEMLGIETNIKPTQSFDKEFTDGPDYRDSLKPGEVLEGEFPAYTQVFSSKMDFVLNLSIIDLLFNLGPEARTYL